MTQAAKVYGGSLYDLAAEEKLDGQIMEQMNEIRQIFRENPEYLKLLGEPAIPLEERIKMLDEAFGGQIELYLLNFLKLLCEKKILREFAGCCEEFRRRYNTDHGIVEAVVTGAVKLKDDQMEALSAKLEKVSGKKIHLTQKTDPTVLAGLRVEMEGRQLDGTVQGRISDITKKYACNIKGKTISPHKLRATYGTTLYNATGDIVLVQKNLHHASINTTLLYVRGMEEKAQKESVEIMKNII